MRNIGEIKINVRDAEGLRPLAQNCSNNEIAHTVKDQSVHRETCLGGAGWKDKLVLGNKIVSHPLLSDR